MTTKRLHDASIKIINDYLHYPMGASTISIPYHNNNRNGVRAGLRALIGKGSIHDINDEVTLLTLREKIDLNKMSQAMLKQFLVIHNIGIDCSGFIYYVLNEESRIRGKGQLKNHLTFKTVNILRKLLNKLRTVQSTNVTTFADNHNSHTLTLSDIQPGDFVTMTHTTPEKQVYNHIILIHEVQYENDTPMQISYSHSIAWPSDGEINHGVRQGIIKIHDITKPLTEQEWIEADKTQNDNYTLKRAEGADLVEIRRLNWF